MSRKKLRRRRRWRKALRAMGGREALRKRVWRILPLLLLTVGLTLALVRVDALDELAGFAQDIQFRSSEPRRDGLVVLVTINDDDYRTTFQKGGGLDPAKLRELVAAIASAGPRVIGVDIDTSDERYRGFQPDPLWPVVWARPVYDFKPQRGQGESPSHPVPLNVLGGQDPALHDGLHSGLPILYDLGNVTRYYQRLIETAEGETLSSFPWTVARRFEPLLAERAATDDQLLIRFAEERSEPGRRTAFLASEVLSFAAEPSGWWSSANGHLRDKIVLVGASHLGQDRHETPLGEMHGLRVMSNVIKTELEGNIVARPGTLTLLPLWSLQSLGLILVFSLFPLRRSPFKNIALSLALVLAASLLCSLLAFLSRLGAGDASPLSHVWFFIPVGVLTLLLQLADELNDWRKARVSRLHEQLGTQGPGGRGRQKRTR